MPQHLILIADSGSTKTDWTLMDVSTTFPATHPLMTLQTEGLNPYHKTEEELAGVLKTLSTHESLRSALLVNLQVYFYGSGCTEAKMPLMRQLLSAAFPRAQISVADDLLGAARALCGHVPGIACILGTGSNSCYYDGQQIITNTPALGYILGDEGGGAYLGKRLISDLLKGQLSAELRDLFLSEYSTTPADLIEHVYRRPQPARYLASFAPFLTTHSDYAELQHLCHTAFTEFFRRNIIGKYPSHLPIHLTGSIAHHFKESITLVANDLDLQLGQITRSPMEGLLRYHS